jgi:predicted small metal-binding protein
MGKVVRCDDVDPSQNCDFVARGETEDEILKQVGEHAKVHNLEPSPELVELVRSHIKDE